MKSTLLIRDPETDEEKRLWSKFEDASRKIRDAKTAQGTEMAYSIAYQNLVKAGLVQQIKNRYR